MAKSLNFDNQVQSAGKVAEKKSVDSPKQQNEKSNESFETPFLQDKQDDTKKTPASKHAPGVATFPSNGKETSNYTDEAPNKAEQALGVIKLPSDTIKQPTSAEKSPISINIAS